MAQSRDRVKALLTEAVTLLCKNSVAYQAEVEVEGLLGITVDRNEVFLVSLHEIISKPEGQQMQLLHPHPQAYSKPFTSTPSYSPTPNKRKRRRKSGERTPQPVVKKAMPIATPEMTEAIVLEDDDEGSNGTTDFQEGAHPAQNTGDTNLDDSSQGQDEPTASDTTFDDLADTSNPTEAFSNQPALDSANAIDGVGNDVQETGESGVVSEERFGDGDDGSMPGASDNIASVKRETFDSFAQQDDSLGDYESFEHEQKYSAAMGLMQPGDSSQGVVGGSGFTVPPGTSTQQSPNTQVGILFYANLQHIHYTKVQKIHAAFGGFILAKAEYEQGLFLSMGNNRRQCDRGKDQKVLLNFLLTFHSL